MSTIPNFKEDFVIKPELYLNCFGLAVHDYIVKKFQALYERFRNEKMSSSTMQSVNASIIDIDYQKELASFETTNEIPPIKARILNFQPITKIKNLKTNMYEKFVSVTGTVVRVSNAKPYVRRLAFECKKCTSTFVNFNIL